ncbi:hypothetical protein CXF59_04930 [Flavobacterium sp. ALD4]|uniref:GIY-YIG nuclease family protein n=1 Tax=Flavobacterium sp. ALD4 TaxID=2058314 RepID=UPI000C344191|nr:GIY-YIG nuclease family protein [Flavobacterium sp. ALD4]PKH68145.1 hypothetical protein CXF59_04930 [Flavobacterium sp. ALD4]
MDKHQALNDIFNDDEFDILNVKPKVSNAKNADERLLATFNEINDFFLKNKVEPQPNATNISEFQLYSRLKGIRENPEKSLLLENEDVHGLLNTQKKEIKSIEDIFNDDMFDILEDDTDLFDFKYTPKPDERAATDFVARRKPCKDFDKFEEMFKKVQNEISNGSRKVLDFKEKNLVQGNYYIHNGILFYLENVDFTENEETFPSGSRVQKNGRTRCVFENGTESNMLYRSIIRALYTNGKIVTQNNAEVNNEIESGFLGITEEDKEEGFIYVLRSKSKDDRIIEIDNLFKIGYSKVQVEERIKNAEKDPTYLMAPVKIVTSWKCYNMNPQKLEQLLHNFFGKACLNIDIYDEKKQRHSPQEWFIAPLEVIEQAIQLIINREVVKYKYDAKSTSIMER